MKPAAGEIEILDQRTDQEVLNEAEERVRSAAKSEGIDPWDEEPISFEVQAVSEPVEDVTDMIDYLEGCRGLQSGSVVIYGEPQGRKRGTEEIAEGIDVNLDFPNERFEEAYRTLDEDFDITDVGFYFTGFGEDGLEAYRSAVPVVTFLMGPEKSKKGADISYRNGGTVEVIWSENDEQMKEVYDSLRGSGLGYHGAAVTGEDDSEWIISNQSYEDLSNL